AIRAARRPLVLAGRGAVAARDEILRLADRLGAPVGTTLKAKELFRDEPHDVGIIGGLAEPAGRAAAEQADLVVAFGAGLNSYTTRRGSLLTGRPVIAVDVRPEGLPAEVAVPVAGDAAAVAGELLAAVDEFEIPAGRFRENLADELARAGRAPRPRTASGTVDIETALLKLDSVLPAPRTVVSDGGRFMMESLRHIRVHHPAQFVWAGNFGSIGTGMGAAIGAAVGRPDHPVVLVSGDGGFMHGGAAEFATAVREGLDLIVIICNDGGYGAEHVQFVERGLDPAMSLFAWPDLARVAEAMGGDAITVRHLDDLEVAAKAIDRRTRPLVIDLRVDVDHITGMQH
ncbi:thiamine pyrophosphate-dependent enzyme, partial [Actinoplanes sp. NPDC049596]